jgi:hypothetical protein
MPQTPSWRRAVEDTPRWLFKFMSLKGERAEYAQRIIEKRTLFFSSPLDFNDPFDCRPRLDAPKSSLLREIRFKRRIKKTPGLSPAQRRALGEKARTEPRERLLEKGREAFTQSMEKLGVTCLSSNITNMAMWSHYADAHAGIAIGFDMRQWPWHDLPLVMEVQYGPQRPVYDILCRVADREDQLFNALCHKAEEWRWEAEWRVLLRNGARTEFLLPPGAIASVIVGANGHEATHQAVRDWVGLEQIALFKARLKSDAYELDLTPL